MSTDGPLSSPTPSSQDRKSLLLVFLLSSVLFGAAMAAVILRIGSTGAVVPAVTAGMFVGLVFGAWMTRFVFVGWRRSGGPRWRRPAWVGVAVFGGVGIYAPFETAKQLRGIEALEVRLNEIESSETGPGTRRAETQ